MASPELSQNLIPENPTLKDLVDLVMKDVMLKLNAHHIAKITAFDSAKQTAQATIAYKKTYFERQENGLYQKVLVDYPILLDCPVIVLGGGPASLTFPIAAGDECLALFNDRDIDTWFSSGQLGPVATSRLHSFSDAILLVGLRSSPNALSSYDMARAVLQYGTTVVAAGETKVKIANADGTLNTILQDLVTAINDLVTATAAITVTCAAPGNPSSPPINVADITAVAADLSTVASQLGDLLE